MKFTELDKLSINTIRGLAIDAVEKAGSGHPGMPLGCSPLAYVLWKHFLKFSPANPTWINRDRFILSAGHGSMLLYALLHLFGFKLSLEEIKNFRQLGSLTPGHPEFGITEGVEVTTGPLGQGVANAVGLAIAEKHLSAVFNEPNNKIIDYKIFVLAGDGCLQEGICQEACSLAGHLGLDNLILIHDNNHITIDGSIDISTSDNQIDYFKSKNWETIEVAGNGNDLQAIYNGFDEAQKQTCKPVFLSIETHIGYGSPNKAQSEKSHGSPLGKKELEQTKKKLNLNPNLNFQIDSSVYKNFNKLAEKGIDLEKKWRQKLEFYKKQYPTKYQLLTTPLAVDKLTKLLESVEFNKDSISTRAASGIILDKIMPKIPTILGGSADLSGSNNTKFKDASIFNQQNYQGRYINYGTREHAMGAIINGIVRSQILKAYGGTFLCFSDYMRPAIRLAALSNCFSIFVFSHDSIGLGEDGPTHQPVEHLAALRTIPNLAVFRPADANETKYAWLHALQAKQPTAIILSRQNLPIYKDSKEASKGAYIAMDTKTIDLLIIATGSELQLAITAAIILKQKKQINARVVSMPCWSLFEEQNKSYQEKILPPTVNKRIAVEAGVSNGWEKYIGTTGSFIGMKNFGASAQAEQLYEHYEITVSKIIKTAIEL